MKSLIYHALEPSHNVNARGGNPARELIDALAACVSAAVIRKAQQKNIRISALWHEIEGVIDTEKFLGFQGDLYDWYRHIQIRFHIQGDSSDETLEGLVKSSEHAVLSGIRSGIEWA